MPYLIDSATFYAGPHADAAGAMGQSEQLLSLLEPSKPMGSSMPGAPLDAPWAPSPEQDLLVSRYVRASSERLRTERATRAGDARRLDDFLASLTRGDRLRLKKADLSPVGGTGMSSNPLQRRLKRVVSALRNELSWCAVAGDDTTIWDTHNTNAAQSRYTDTLFASLSQLAKDLEANGLADSTAVVVLSEMGRTPKLNANRGKDHWPVTSALLFGAGVRGGKVYGATDDRLEARTVDFATGQPDATGGWISAASLAAGILTLAGVDPAAHMPGIQPFTPFAA